MYDIDELEVDNLIDVIEIGIKFEEMIRKGELFLGFILFGRMFILEIKIKGVFMIYFLCVFWYGFYNFRKKVDLLEEFKNLLVFIK